MLLNCSPNKIFLNICGVMILSKLISIKLSSIKINKTSREIRKKLQTGKTSQVVVLFNFIVEDRLQDLSRQDNPCEYDTLFTFYYLLHNLVHLPKFNHNLVNFIFLFPKFKKKKR